MIQAILDHPKITVHLDTSFTRAMGEGYDHVFCCDPLDGYFDFELGRLGYRTLDFERFDYDRDCQGCAVMNCGEETVPCTRFKEHKQFAPWEEHERSVYYREFSRSVGSGDIPYYPIRQVKEKELLSVYVDLANASRDVTFVGRLGTYRYLDMGVTIRESLDNARGFEAKVLNGEEAPAFLSNLCRN